MYISKYFTNEQIDQRLLEGYYDDFVNAGFVGTKQEFFEFVLSIADCVKSEEGKGLSSNDFTDELKSKLDAIEAGATAVSKISQLENDLKYQTEGEVRAMINGLIGGASEALDTLKELSDALGNDPDFAGTVTNKLTEISNKIEAEVERAKAAEESLTLRINDLNDKVNSTQNNLLEKIQDLKADIQEDLDLVDDKINSLDDKFVDKVTYTKGLSDQKEEILNTVRDYNQSALDKIEQEKDRALAAEKLNADTIDALEKAHINDRADLEKALATETAERKTKDSALESELNIEKSLREAQDNILTSHLEKEVTDRTAADEALRNELLGKIDSQRVSLEAKLSAEISNRESDTASLTSKISQEALERKTQDAILEHSIGDLETLVNEKTSSLEEKVNQTITSTIENINSQMSALALTKVDKEEGKGLSSNDFTDELKSKLINLGPNITKVSELINDLKYQTEDEVNALIAKVVGGAPEALDTLKELADALGDDRDFAGTITRKITAITEQLNQIVEDRGEDNTRLESLITAEKERAQSVEDLLTSQITQEKEDRRIADTEIKELIKDNKTSQDTVNADLRASIAELRVALNAKDADLLEKIQVNIAAIQRNFELIQSWQDKVEELKLTFTSKFDQEVLDRIAGDNELKALIESIRSTLVDQITSESDARLLKDKELEASISALDNKVSTQIENLEDADTVLNNRVDNLVAADTVINEKIDDLIAADEAINDRIDNLTFEYLTEEEITNIYSEIFNN